MIKESRDPQAGTSAGEIERVATYAYDAMGRLTSEHLVVANGSPGDDPVPATTCSYNPTTGALRSISNGDSVISLSYDSWGREVSRTDSSGNTSEKEYDRAGHLATLDDGKGTYSYTYDGPGERRGLVTGLDVDLPGGQPDQFSVEYGPSGAPTSMIHPNGIIAEWQYDTAGNANSLSYRIGDESLTFSQTYDMEGRVQTASSVASTQTHKYDRVDRLTQVEDSFGLGPSSSRTCQRREYAFSRDSNRESLTTSGANSEGKCDGSRPLATRSTFDSADRISGGRLQVSYYANDMVAGSKQTVPRANGEGSLLSEYDYDLDPLSRIGSTVLKSDSVVTRTTRNHYVDDSNSPAWSEYVDRSGNSSVASEARFIRSPLGYQAGLQVDRGNAQFYIVNLHGDTVASFDNPASGAVATIGTCRESTEYGISRASLQSPQGGSAWLGAARPEVDSGGGLYAMGMGLYNPHTGRFLSPDPVRGGNDNSYTYPPDPVNSFDLSGEYRTTKWFNPYWTRGGFGIEAGFFVQLTRKEALGTAAGVSITWGIYRAIHAVLEGPKHRAFSRTNMEKFRRTTMRAFGGFAALAASEFVGWYIGVMAWNKKGPFFGLTVSADVRWGRLTVYILPLMLFVSC